MLQKLLGVFDRLPVFGQILTILGLATLGVRLLIYFFYGVFR